MAPTLAGEAALAELAACNPAELSRVTKLREVHARCARAGVCTSTAAGSSAAAAAEIVGTGAADVALLYALFDTAVLHGMPQLVCHYVEEVCSHDDFSSPDGVEVSVHPYPCVREKTSERGRSDHAWSPFSPLPLKKSQNPNESTQRSTYLSHTHTHTHSSTHEYTKSLSTPNPRLPTRPPTGVPPGRRDGGGLGGGGAALRGDGGAVQFESSSPIALESAWFQPLSL
jgi:hypothetical protein